MNVPTEITSNSSAAPLLRRAPTTVALVVDDLPLDRIRAGSLLRIGLPADVLYAQDGEEALRRVRDYQPDLVITDLHMPRFGGLELVEALRSEFPALPTIVMTGHGDESTAVRSLLAGASAYVAKAWLGDQLVPTARRILSFSTQESLRRQMFAHKTLHEEHFVVDNDPQALGPLASHLETQLSQFWHDSGHHSIQLALALHEALSNALFHGNLGLTSALRELPGEEYWNAAAARRTSPPWCHRRIHVFARIEPHQARFTIRDEGDGFDWTTVAAPTEEHAVARPHGRGIFLMRLFVHQVEFSADGRQVDLVLRRHESRRIAP